MRTVKLFFFILLLSPCIGVAQNTENIFTIQSGRVIPKSTMIDPLDKEDTKSERTLISTEKIISKDHSSEYQISLYDYDTYRLDGFPGTFRLIDIKKGTKELLKLSNLEAWDTIPRIHIHGEKRNFLASYLSDKMTVLLFLGHNFTYEPGFLTIIVLNGEEATLVYNKNMYPIELTCNVANLSTYVANGFIQYLSDENDKCIMDTETLPNKYHIWSENGLLKIQNLGKITKEFLE